MQHGQLTVIGKDSTRILLTGRPRVVEVHFVDHDVDPIPCSPHHHHHHEDDRLRYEIEGDDEDPRERNILGHHHHNRIFYLVISWEVDEVREIQWYVHN